MGKAVGGLDHGYWVSDGCGAIKATPPRLVHGTYESHLAATKAPPGSKFCTRVASFLAFRVVQQGAHTEKKATFTKGLIMVNGQRRIAPLPCGMFVFFMVSK